MTTAEGPTTEDHPREGLLGWPSAAALIAFQLGMLALWVPRHLTRPLYADHDLFAAMTQG